jgi:MAF protein
MSERAIYLASGSPRRRELVRSLGLPVIAGIAPFDEEEATAAYSGDTAHLAEHLARAKAGAALHAETDTLPAGTAIVAADTTVLLDGQSLAKPRDAADARRMLTLLRNRRHQVVTALAVATVEPPHDASSSTDPEAAEPMRSLSVTTQVLMRDYTDAEISAYIATGDPFDKAGAYAIQHPAFHPVAAIEGCYLCVVGLPLCALTYLLASSASAAESEHSRYRNQEAQREAATCPWSQFCRSPLPCWYAEDEEHASRGHAR